MLTGCGIKRGVVVGATDEDGVDVAEKPFNEKNLFATIFTALGIDPYAAYDLPELPAFHRVEEKAAPIREVLVGREERRASSVERQSLALRSERSNAPTL